MNKPSVLFILKRRSVYSGYSHGISSGLFNSALFCKNMLASLGYSTKLVEVTDNNDIDREVTLFKPDITIIEALWVVPSKFAVLKALHPSVQWIVRLHSEAPFLSQEGIAMLWIPQYAAIDDVFVAVNSKEAFMQFTDIFPIKDLSLNKLLYLPTFYPVPTQVTGKKFKGNTLNAACMGALRTLKNPLIQAEAAMKFSESNGWTLNFHVNACLWDMEGSPIYKNLINLFTGTRHKLVSHDWLSHDDFLKFLKSIDLGMQVSFTETFCIVAADIVASGVPIVGSETIRWLDDRSQADPIQIMDIISKLTDAMQPRFFSRSLTKINLEGLRGYAEDAQQAWENTLNQF